jgi:hypothetical protein
MSFLKQKVSSSLKKAGLDPLEALSFDANEESDDRLDERDEDENSSNAESEDDASAASEDSEVHRHAKKRSSKHNRQVSEESAADGYIPWSILSPDKYSLESKDGPIGRQFPWGFADPFNPVHCDFVKLKDAVFAEWRLELREASREVVSFHRRNSPLSNPY